MTNRECLFLILRCAFGYADIKEHNICLSDENLAYLYNAARVHSLFPIISKVLIENSLVSSDSEYYQPFRKQMLKYVCRRERFDFVLDAVCKAFDCAEIPYMPLKGSVLKDHYPEAWMRTGADIDILVKKCDLESAERVLSDVLNYSFISRSSHDIVYTSPNKVHIELHYSLNEPGYKVFEPLESIWDVAQSVEGSNLYEMPSEYFWLYHIAHMAKHFVCGGCGVRFFTDMRVILDKFGIDDKKVKQLLETCGLTKFNDAVVSLSEVWFLHKEHNKLTEVLEIYVLSGGTFGNLQNKAAFGQARQGSRLKYALSRVFLPYDQMVNFYPVLKEKKYLTPIYEVRRWFRLIFRGGLDRSAKELKYNSATDDVETENAKFLAENLEL